MKTGPGVKRNKLYQSLIAYHQKLIVENFDVYDSIKMKKIDETIRGLQQKIMKHGKYHAKEKQFHDTKDRNLFDAL